MSVDDIINSEAFKKCEVFHGHICPGLAIGYRAATAAMAWLQGMHKTNRALKTIEVPQLLDLSVSVYPAGNVAHNCCSDIAGLLIFSPRTPCVYFHEKMVERRIEFEGHIFLV